MRVFFLGGFETFYFTIYFRLYELARDTDIQRKLQAKIDNVIKKRKGDVTYEDTMTEVPCLEQVVNETSKTLTTKEVAAQAWVFFLAGFETSSTTVSFCLYELARHPDIQKKVQEEIDDALKKNNGDVTYDIIMTQMPYLEKVVNETLRMYPPATVLNREVVQDYKLPGYDCVLEKGTKVFIPVLGLHHDRKFFRTPEKFDPEHFSEEQKASRHPYCYLPFGEGPRLCIGMRFGLMQVKLALVHLLPKFDLLPVGDNQSKLRIAPNNFVLTAIVGIELRVEHRRISVR
ncbi:probable cytochrome P450 6a13 [Schistocerca piceifrons]|uniref:probable cytochrome P450 6a13 n=1 Tax=Schistocerca piceifrons TaxID=274613 RepID=UPI001F5FAD70|nr:probable cytochrome P450 6a13 [Schistocerca piceifrons]